MSIAEKLTLLDTLRTFDQSIQRYFEGSFPEFLFCGERMLALLNSSVYDNVVSNIAYLHSLYLWILRLADVIVFQSMIPTPKGFHLVPRIIHVWSYSWSRHHLLLFIVISSYRIYSFGCVVVL